MCTSEEKKTTVQSEIEVDAQIMAMQLTDAVIMTARSGSSSKRVILMLQEVV